MININQLKLKVSQSKTDYNNAQFYFRHRNNEKKQKYARKYLKKKMREQMTVNRFTKMIKN